MRSQKLKKTFFVLVAVVYIIAASVYVYASKESTEGGAKKETTISVLMCSTPQSDMIEQLHPEFTAETGIKVNLEMIAYEDSHSKGVLDLVSGTSNYDVLMMDNPWLGEYVKTGNVLPLTEYMENEEPGYIEGFDQNALEVYGYYEGTYYAYPIMFGVMLLMYRTDLFENYSDEYAAQYGTQLRPPKTWEEYLQIARFFTKEYNPGSPVKYGVSIAGERGDGAISEFLPWVWGCGGNIFDKDWNVTTNTPEVIKAFRLFGEQAKYAPPGFVNMVWEESLVPFANGDVAIIETWDVFSDPVINPDTSKVYDRVGFASVPGGIPLLGGWGMVINKNSSDVDAAYEFLRWACGPEVAEKSLDIAVVTPTRRDVYEKPEVRKRIPWADAALENFPKVRKYADAYAGGPILIPEAEYHVILGTICNEVLAGTLTPEEAALRAEREITALLDEHDYY